MARTPTGSRNKTIHCDICGEDYAATYKRCPFCNGRPPEQPSARGSRPPRRNTRGGGYSTPSPVRIISTVISLALIVAAVCIVISIIKPMVDKGKPITPPSATPAPTPTAQPTPSVAPSAQPSPGVPADQTAASFSLDKSDFTVSNYQESHSINATFSPAGSVGYLEWTSSNPEVVSVDDNGRITALGRSNGVSRATITATLKGTNITQTCIVRCNFDAPAGATVTPTAPSTAAPSGSLSLNKTDFTMEKQGQTVTMRVNGTSSTPTWSIDDTSIATVSSDGVVTAVANSNGKAVTLTCTVDGQTLTCLVRCKF
ncbi:Ig domain-containing protein [Pseudoflavonifractor sp. 524-17]|uniref:Ig-like domain-containing protein n=1 Tax=Pseudoflavonifractor sp. 524-17 TaxID=2304577 RepID=UPI0013798D58|nr:Ig-like domain-containing protein [Pseudoflavonifractor sp. 524-17]NCE64025.1 Ig domain-containing protein [Pseudoflavonifractor sp. 524-17]